MTPILCNVTSSGNLSILRAIAPGQEIAVEIDAMPPALLPGL
jgi:hypothetical protein